MKYRSVFQVIGPIMIGPSSSHTAGACRIGLAARRLLDGEPRWAKITLYGSFAKTYRGHGTDRAIVGGILGLGSSDPRIRHAVEMAAQDGIQVDVALSNDLTEHPNTARVQLGNDQGGIELVGMSVGGGAVEIIEIDGFALRLSGERPALLVFHQDRPGVIANVARLLSNHGINIAQMEVSRSEPGGEALMVIEPDQRIGEALEHQLTALRFVSRVSRLEL